MSVTDAGLKKAKETTSKYIDNAVKRGSDYEWKVRSSRNQKFVEHAKTRLSTPKPSITSKVLNTLGKVSKVLTPVAIAEFLYSGYTSGQKSSGGRYGFEQNPSYDASKTGVKHGDASSNAMFIPTKGRAYKDMFSIGKSKIINPK